MNQDPNPGRQTRAPETRGAPERGATPPAALRIAVPRFCFTCFPDPVPSGRTLTSYKRTPTPPELLFSDAEVVSARSYVIIPRQRAVI